MTRTERFVHRSPDHAEPVVDERTVTRVVRDNATVQEIVNERQALPLNEEERDHWMRDPHEEPEAEAIFHQSREAMVINDFQETPEGVVETQTLITQHVVPEAAPQIHEQEDVKERESAEAEIHGDASVQEAQPSYEEEIHHEDVSPGELPAPTKYEDDQPEAMIESATGLFLATLLSWEENARLFSRVFTLH